MSRRRLLLLLASAALAAGCGKKGPLKRSDEKKAARPAAAPVHG